MSMKYDSSMTRFHDDIVGALRSMLHGDIDKITELAADGSPTPLREYLKDNHGKCFHGGNKFDCTPSAFFVIFTDIILNDSGDKKLQLSWSQVATFIRNNAAEIFDDLDKSPKTYLDVLKEHYPNADFGIVYTDYCPGDFFEGAVNSQCDNCTDNYEDSCEDSCKNCWNMPADEEWSGTSYYVPEEWKAIVEQEQTSEGSEISDEEFNKNKAALEAFVSSVDEKKMTCPHWNKGHTLNNKGFGAVEFDCAMHKESFFEEGKLKHFLTTHCYNQIWCPFCDHPEAVQDKPSEPPATDFPTCSCPLWRSEAFKIVGDRKKSISFSCDACHSEDITDENTVSDIEHRCNKYLDCKHFLIHELEPVLKAESIKVNVNTPLDRLKQLYETHCQQTVPVPSGTGAPAKNAIDYTALPTELCDYLRNKEEQLKNEYMNFTANCGRIFAEAQEKLAKHGFGENNGMFEKWINSMGFAKRSVYRMIQIYEFRSCQIGTNEGQVLFDALPKTLQADISAPSAPPDIVERVMNGDITTHKDFIKLKKELEEANKKIELAEFHSKQQSESFKRVADTSKTNYEKYQEERHKNDDLEKRIRELENRPIDVAAPDDEEIERIAAERSRELLRAKDMECDRRLREMQNEGKDKDKEISELKERLMTVGEDSEQIENFFEDMYNDAYRALKRCFEFVSESNFTPQTVNKLRLRLNSFPGVVKDFIEEME